jgi:hypothetical protein
LAPLTEKEVSTQKRKRNLMNTNEWRTINQTKHTEECTASKKIEKKTIFKIPFP